MNPTRFGKFWLIDKVAAGGMAEIYRAVAHTADGQPQVLAIKRILPQFSGDEEFVSLLMDEAKLMVLLNHPNVVPIFEFGQVEGAYYIAMEYVEGTTLKGLFKRVVDRGEHFTIDLAVHICREIGDGLAYAQRKTDEKGSPLGIVHRDISPTNILMSFEGEIKIADFGISKAANQSHRTQIGVIRGKTGYMSPEQTKSGGVIDHRSDLYALGIILFELLTGKRLYQANSVPEALAMIRKGEIPSITALRAEVPPALEQIVLKALAVDPEKRYQRTDDFVDALNEFLTRWTPTGRPLRITHTDLVGFVRRYFPLESNSSSGVIPKLQVEKGLTDPPTHAKSDSVRTAVGPRRTLAANPLYELSENEFELPPTLSFRNATTQVVTQSLVNAMSASFQFARGWSRQRVSVATAGVIAVVLIGSWIVGRRTPAPGTPAPTSIPSPTATSTASPGPRLASLRVRADPADVKLRVFVDGKETKQDAEGRIGGLEIGKEYLIRVSAEGYQPNEQRVKVQDANPSATGFVLVKAEPARRPTPVVAPPARLGGPKKRKIPLGALAASSQPKSVSVYVDGKFFESTPFVRKSLPSGRHRIRFVTDDKKSVYEFSVTVLAGKELRCIDVDVVKGRGICR